MSVMYTISLEKDGENVFEREFRELCFGDLKCRKSFLFHSKYSTFEEGMEAYIKVEEALATSCPDVEDLLLSLENTVWFEEGSIVVEKGMAYYSFSFNTVPYCKGYNSLRMFRNVVRLLKDAVHVPHRMVFLKSLTPNELLFFSDVNTVRAAYRVVSGTDEAVFTPALSDVKEIRKLIETGPYESREASWRELLELLDEQGYSDRAAISPSYAVCARLKVGEALYSGLEKERDAQGVEWIEDMESWSKDLSAEELIAAYRGVA